MSAPAKPLPETITARELAQVALRDPDGVTALGVRLLAGAVLELDIAASAGLMRRGLYEPKPTGART